MGEILRAILDQNAVDSRPAFYGAQISITAAGGAVAFGNRQTSIACKADTWFLVMGYMLDSAQSVAGANGWFNRLDPSQVQLVRGGNLQSFSASPQMTPNINNDLNNFVTLDEYVLFEPAELITLNLFVRTNAVPVGAVLWHLVTLAGVEYQMPARFDPRR